MKYEENFFKLKVLLKNKKVVKQRPHKNLYANIYSNFINNHQKNGSTGDVFYK